jgi:NTP pyrophosphatase (non-canonical NTP hydrolase)
MTDKETLKTAIAVYGEQAQEEKAIEELAELICAITHKHCGRPHNIAEEIADVLITVEQLIMINDCHEAVEEIRAVKVKRLAERIFDKCL